MTRKFCSSAVASVSLGVVCAALLVFGIADVATGTGNPMPPHAPTPAVPSPAESFSHITSNYNTVVAVLQSRGVTVTLDSGSITNASLAWKVAGLIHKARGEALVSGQAYPSGQTFDIRASDVTDESLRHGIAEVVLEQLLIDRANSEGRSATQADALSFAKTQESQLAATPGAIDAAVPPGQTIQTYEESSAALAAYQRYLTVSRMMIEVEQLPRNTPPVADSASTGPLHQYLASALTAHNLHIDGVSIDSSHLPDYLPVN